MRGAAAAAGAAAGLQMSTAAAAEQMVNTHRYTLLLQQKHYLAADGEHTDWQVKWLARADPANTSSIYEIADQPKHTFEST